MSELSTMIYKLSDDKITRTPSSTTRHVQGPRQIITCRNCRGQGHIRRHCKWNGTGNASSDQQCQLYNQTAHTTLECLLYKSSSSTTLDNIVCHICSKKGHIASQCFRYQGNANHMGNTGPAPPGKI